jgi:hypothetical protein
MPRWAAALALAGLFAMPAVGADLAKSPVGKSPVGSWQSADGQARVKVTMCGDGTELCAQLTGLSGEARNAENLELLNRLVVDRAALADTNVWHGKVHFNGTTATGNIRLEGANVITVSGCQLGMCRTYQFKRI